MNEFEYTIKDENGVHARPAGLIVKQAQTYDFDVNIECNGKTASLKKLLALMGMGIKKGDTVKVSAQSGKDISELKKFFEKNL
ncbi:MAG: HPr family phosphocarrier protein [Clostridia bacterium]|nr:HPr family phosphocarrier protein [Clostridia bacterium]